MRRAYKGLRTPKIKLFEERKHLKWSEIAKGNCVCVGGAVTAQHVDFARSLFRRIHTSSVAVVLENIG